MKRILISLLAFTCCGSEHSWISLDSETADPVALGEDDAGDTTSAGGDVSVDAAEPGGYPWESDDCEDPDPICPEGWDTTVDLPGPSGSTYRVTCEWRCAKKLREGCDIGCEFSDEGACNPDCVVLQIWLSRSVDECGWSEMAVSQLADGC